MNRKNQSKSKPKNDSSVTESEQRPARKKRGVVSKIASMLTKNNAKKTNSKSHGPTTKPVGKSRSTNNVNTTTTTTTSRIDLSEKTCKSYKKKASKQVAAKTKRKSNNSSLPSKSQTTIQPVSSSSANTSQHLDMGGGGGGGAGQSTGASTMTATKTESTWHKPTISAEKVETGIVPLLADFETKNLHDLFREQWDFIEEFEVSDDACRAFLANEDKNQAEDVECLDANRVKLERQNTALSDYIHASNVEVKDIARKFILTQLPKLSASSREDFWMMIYQQSVHNIYLLCSNSESTASGGDKFREYFPTSNGHHEYYGQIWVHNRKVELASESEERPVDIYTVEVLPEGCAESVMVTIYVFPHWTNRDIPNAMCRKKLVALAANVLASQDAYETDPVAIISKCGAGRAGAFLTLLSAIHLVKNGMVPNIKEIGHKIRTQRPGAIDTEAQMVFVYIGLFTFSMQYIVNRDLKCRVEKVCDDVEKFLQKKSAEDASATTTTTTDTLDK